MCGVAGIFAYHYAAAPVDRAELRVIRDAMEKRGPDGSGEWFSQDGRVGLGHRRLAIIDLDERANQPMISLDGKYVISFNGEIYNYRELKIDLEKKGRCFRTSSDTEVLLQMYAEYGTDMLPKLRGMFAFGLWDSDKKALMLARGPAGIKPLYFADDGWTIRFASQVKALLKSQRVSKDPEPAGAVGFFLLGSVPEPFTLYQEIRAFPAGSFMWVDDCGPSEVKEYFSFSKVFLKEAEFLQKQSEKDIQEFVRQELLDSVLAHLTADVPVGLFLSAGIDSTLLLHISSHVSTQPLQTLTLAFDEYRGSVEDEAPLAEETAKHYSAQHTTYRLTRREFEEDLPKVFEAMDQPTIDGINAYFISKAAKTCGLKVALSGLGGDELFGGYSSFSDIPKLRRASFLPALLPFSGEIFKSLFNFFLEPLNIFHPKFSGLLKFGGSTTGAYFLKRGLYMPWDLDKLMLEDISREGVMRLRLKQRLQKTLALDPKADFARVAILELEWYLRNQLLRDTDWASMAHSIEVRTPYVDSFLFKRLLPAIGMTGGNKNKSWIMSYHKNDLPEGVFSRKKTGFTIPMSAWLNTQLEETAKDSKKILKLPWARKWSRHVYERAVC